MSGQHTLGPWSFNADFHEIQAESGTKTLAVVDVNKGEFIDDDELAANARLIAAAPDMATVLLWIRENLHPKALGRGATAAELYAITHATMVLREAGVIPTPELIEAEGREP